MGMQESENDNQEVEIDFEGREATPSNMHKVFSQH